MREQRVIDPTQTRRADSTDVNAASPHRAGHYNGTHPEDRPHVTDEQRPRHQIRRPVQYRYDDGTDDEEVFDTRSPSSARRYQVPATKGPRTVVRYHHQQIPLRRSRTVFINDNGQFRLAKPSDPITL